MEIEILLPSKTYNMERLHSECKAALGATFYGISAALGATYAVLASTATPAQQAQAIALAEAHNATVLTPAQQTVANIKTTAQSAEGIALADLTAAQVKALLAVLLYRNGAVAADGKVRPLADWAG